jgi:Putative adhesin
MVLAAPLAAQTPCSDGSNWGGGDRAGHCEMREQTIADTGRLNVDAGTNGGIRITGADRSDILIRARVQTSAPTAEEAKAMMSQVQVQAAPGTVRANGPGQIRDRGWSVSFEIQVPRRSGLDLKAHNGGIAISDVEGEMRFDTQNGGVTLTRVAGDVRGKTQNGGLKVELAGNTWRGNQLDVQTTNGGINVKVPEGYSAQFETSTVNGRVQADVPGANVVKGQNDRNISVTLGSGGPLVRLVTTNGGIHLSKS